MVDYIGIDIFVFPPLSLEVLCFRPRHFYVWAEEIGGVGFLCYRLGGLDAKSNCQVLECQWPSSLFSLTR